MMIYLKLLLALLLSAVPFIYAGCVRPKGKTSPVWRNLFTAIGAQTPRLRIMKRKMKKFLHRLHEGMKKNDKFRRFFSLVTLLLMIVVQFIDFSTATSIAGMLQEASRDNQQTAQTIAVYGALMTRPHATVLAACLSLALFSYQVADWVLTRLHNKRKLFFSVALLTLTVLFASPRYFIVAEVLEMVLLAALVYPNQILAQDPKGRRPIPKINGKLKQRKAA